MRRFDDLAQALFVLKVLQVFKDYYPPTRGGVEQHIHEVVHGLEGVEFTVLTSSRKRRGTIEHDGSVHVIRAPEYARPSSTAVTPSWVKYFRQRTWDLVHFHAPNPFGELAFLASRSTRPLVVTYHSDIVGRKKMLPFFLPFQQRFLSRACRVVVSNPRLLETSPSLSAHRSRAVVVPFGVDVESWSQPPAGAAALKKKHPGPLVVFLGRLAYYKGVEVLVEAMASIEATLLVVGGGPKRLELEQMAKELGVAAKVFFVGEIEDQQRAAFYHAADVFVLPATARAETFGIAMLEAMACATPVVSTEVGTGTSWLNESGVTGRVVAPGDSRALAVAIGEILADEPLRAQMGRAALRRVKENFSKQQMLGSLRAVYESVI